MRQTVFRAFVWAREGLRLGKNRAELLLDGEIAERCVDGTTACDTVLVSLVPAVGERIQVFYGCFARRYRSVAEEALLALLN